ncbi:cellulose binding domain-containing protein [Streptomyces echinoruber]|uniref:CBM2 domain-containing protein n=1 Tax=Streptomyces echinoruber TaxID=68898 RepID=A0A918RK60_9ACTN|nr:cellulose binding domain-containing protein [Streptomyces echinoruber]GHA00213.1 hypothetical protein GCM10010389_44170 [Streptomyces echinoruber]
MPDLPKPKDDTEAALFSECWDAVLSYADLCTAGSTAAQELATEAFALGMRGIRAADAGPGRTPGRRTGRLPRIPQLLTAVRDTAAAWEAGGQGHRLDPDLRLWLHSDKAARYTGPPLERPLALRALKDLQEADATLLWLAEVEALPAAAAARRLGLDPATAPDDLDEVRGLFRDRCRSNHLDSPLAPECRSYARLLDAVTRSPGTETPDDLSRHLATCVRCAEAAACLRLHGGGLPAALAAGVVGWGGLAYLERRRRATDVRLGAPRPARREKTDTGDPEGGAGRARAARNGLLAAAVLLSLVALAVSMMPLGGSGGSGDDTAARDGTGSQPVAEPRPSLPAVDPATGTTPASPRPTAHRTTRTAGTPGARHADPEPQGTSSTVAAGPTRTGPSSGGSTPTVTAGPPPCTVEYRLVDQWPDGFQATVAVTTVAALDDWRVTWSFRDGQRIDRMWDADFTQSGSRVTAAATDYNRSVAAGGRVAFGFIASWREKNSAPYGFALNGHGCKTG